MDDMEFITEENEHGEPCEILSPSGRFKLTIRHYNTKKGCWDYSRGTVIRVEDGEEICDIVRNYGSFHHSFVEKRIPGECSGCSLCRRDDGTPFEYCEEWLITGRSYMSQTVVNLETGDIYEPAGDQHDGFAFCWADCMLSPDGNTLMVDGCHWACPYEFRFYDFTDPSKGWPELKIYKDGEETYLDADSKKPPVWKEDGTFECYEVREIYKPLNKDWNEMTVKEMEAVPDGDGDELPDTENVVVARRVLKRVGDRMEVAEDWVSDEEAKHRAEMEEASRKFKEFRKNFRENDPLCKTLEKRIRSDLLPDAWGEGWYGWGWKDNERTVSKTLGVGNGSVEITWGVETGPIRITLRGSKDKREVEFERSEAGMVAATRMAKREFGLLLRLWCALKRKLRKEK